VTELYRAAVAQGGKSRHRAQYAAWQWGKCSESGICKRECRPPQSSAVQL